MRIPFLLLSVFLLFLFGSAGEIYRRFSPYLAGSIEVPIGNQVQWISADGEARGREELADGPQARLILIRNGGPSEQVIRMERDNDYGIDRVLMGHDTTFSRVLGVDGTAARLTRSELRFEGLALPPTSQLVLLAFASAPTTSVTRTSATTLHTGGMPTVSAYVFSTGEIVVWVILSLFVSLLGATVATWQAASLYHNHGWGKRLARSNQAIPLE